MTLYTPHPYKGALTSSQVNSRLAQLAASVESVGGVSVARFGASGDGSDATEALTEALAAAGAGGTVLFPPGEYVIGERFVPAAGVAIRGAGIGRTRIIRKDQDPTLQLSIFFLANEDCYLADMTIDGNEAIIGQHTLQEVEIYGERSVGERLRFENWSNMAVALGGSHTQLRFVDCIGSGDPDNGGEFSNSMVGIYCQDPDGEFSKIIGCHVYGTYTGGIGLGGRGHLLEGNTVQDCHQRFTFVGGGSITLNGAGAGQAGGHIVRGNHIDAENSGDYTSGFEVDANRVIIEGNQVWNCTNYGAIIQSGTGAQIRGNRFVSCGNAAYPTGAAISVNADLGGFGIVGNRIEDLRSPAETPHGIFVTAGTGDDYMIVGNDVHDGWVTAAVTDLAAGSNVIVSDNLS